MRLSLYGNKILLMRSTRYTILVANRETGVVRRFTLPLKPVLLGILAVVAVPVLVGLGA